MTRVPVPARHVWLFWLIALGGAAFDLTTKWVIFRELGEPNTGPAYSVVGNVLELRTSYNPGALWGFGRDWAYSSLIFAALSGVASLAICFWLFFRGGARDLRLTIALALIMAGALGNCYDRVVYGHVRDFVHFHVDSINFNFAIFNFADNMLVAGAMILMLLALRPESESESAPEPTVTEPVITG